jgi:thiol-disulfide isomerase/thioredoxin
MRTTDAPPRGDVDALVRAAVTAATAEKRRVVVYVGAPWCEPCQRFHHAVERGDLDGTFPDVDLLTFDADRDGERLASAGYVSKLIPLLALPGPDGRASGKQVEGGIKGEGAVGYIAPRLQQMLAD